MTAARTADLIRQRTRHRPKVAIVLGSGLGALLESLGHADTIAYADLPGFPATSVSGHAGALVVGHLSGVAVAVLAGREHYYERGRADAMRPAIEALGALGVDTLVLTNAAGSLRQEAPPGSIMLIADHINLAGANPLIGETTDARFVGLGNAYDRELARIAVEVAAVEGIGLSTGVYAWFSGPSFETPAEIRAARVLGADAVGMSTVPEVILARFLGLKVVAFSVITNMAAGMDATDPSHEQTKRAAARSGADLTRLLTRLVGALP